MDINILDFERINTLLEGFNRSTGFVTAIIDLEGNVLSKSGWRQICTEFHRGHQETARRCVISDTALAGQMEAGDKYHFYRCLNGLIDAAVPIVIEDEHIANLFSGQFFFEPPDLEFFRRQARQFGFDEEAYLKALEKVPVLDESRVRVAMDFLLKMTEMISEMSFQKLEQIQLIERQRKSEEALRQSREDLKEAQRIAHVGSWSLDKASGWVTWSEELYRIHGLSPTLAPPTREEYSRLFTPESWERLFQALRATQRTGVPHELEVETVGPSGTRGWLWAYGEVVYNRGGVVTGLRGVAQDITPRKRAEAEQADLKAQLQQSQKMESIGRLAGGVAHDFNNMLSIILGNAEMAMEGIAPEDPNFESLVEILRAGERSANLTRQLLAFARKQIVAPKVLDLNGVLSDMVNMLKRLIGEDIELRWLPGENLAAVKMDPSQVDQILANLCVNARDAIESVGKIILETANASFDEEYCSRHPGFIPGDYVMIAVSDNGSGMDRETMDNIFEPFFSTKKGDLGSGLGLATVFGIVRQNNGFINVYSEKGFGSSFKIYLPRHGEGQAAAEKVLTETQETPATERVLLVEDDPSMLKLTRMMLERLGYRVLSAQSPAEALALADAPGPDIDLVLTDVVMPEMNGRDLASALQARFPGLPCLFMSGYTANVIARHGVLDNGMNFIGKPFSKKELAGKLRDVIGR